MTINDKLNTQLRKGAFELAMLLMIQKKPMYGYELTKELQDSSTFPIADGSIYPILKRLATNDCIDPYTEEHEGRNRKYYRITNNGRQLLASKLEEFEQIYNFLKTLQKDDVK